MHATGSQMYCVSCISITFFTVVCCSKYSLGQTGLAHSFRGIIYSAKRRLSKVFWDIAAVNSQCRLRNKVARSEMTDVLRFNVAAMAHLPVSHQPPWNLEISFKTDVRKRIRKSWVILTVNGRTTCSNLYQKHFLNMEQILDILEAGYHSVKNRIRYLCLHPLTMKNGQTQQTIYRPVWLNTAKDCKGPQRTAKDPQKTHKGPQRSITG